MMRSLVRPVHEARAFPPSRDGATSFPKSHSWQLAPLLSSVSDPSLQQRSFPTNKRHPATPAGRQYTLTIDQAAKPGPPSLVQPPVRALGASAGSRTLEIEHRLREYLAQQPASSGAPSRSRTHMALETLHELGCIPSTFSAFMPLLASELANAIIAPGSRGPAEGVRATSDPQESMRFYFEVVSQLREEIKEWKQTVHQMQRAVDEAERMRAAGQAECERMQQRVLEVEAALEARKNLEKKHSRELARAHRDYSLLQDERDAIEQRCAAEEQKCRTQDDKVKEVQVSLFVEQKRSVEQGQLYKELRLRKNQELREAAVELSRYKRALLRFHHAYLRATGNKGRTFDLNKLSIDEQVGEALRWAGLELDAVLAESQLHLPPEVEETADEPAASSTSPQKPPARPQSRTKG